MKRVIVRYTDGGQDEAYELPPFDDMCTNRELAEPTYRDPDAGDSRVTDAEQLACHAYFALLRALSRTPAKIRPRSWHAWKRGIWRDRWWPAGEDPADYPGGHQIESQRDHPEAAGERGGRGAAGTGVICELDQNDLLPRLKQAQAWLAMAEAQVPSPRGRSGAQ